MATSGMCSRVTTSFPADRARCPRHDAGPQGGAVEPPKIGFLQHGPEHGRDAVQGGAAFSLDGLKNRVGLEGLTGDDHAGPVADTGKAPQDTPEAVEKRHGKTHPVVLAVAEGLPDEEAVVEDVVV